MVRMLDCDSEYSGSIPDRHPIWSCGEVINAVVCKTIIRWFESNQDLL